MSSASKQKQRVAGSHASSRVPLPSQGKPSPTNQWQEQEKAEGQTQGSCADACRQEMDYTRTDWISLCCLSKNRIGSLRSSCNAAFFASFHSRQSLLAHAKVIVKIGHFDSGRNCKGTSFLASTPVLEANAAEGPGHRGTCTCCPRRT